MGNWAVTIHGHGIHDNGKDEDAERQVSQFVKQLRDSGQVVNAVRFTVGHDRELDQSGEWKVAL